MKIYIVEYISAEGNVRDYFSSKVRAEKYYRELKKVEGVESDVNYIIAVEQVFDIEESELSLNKKGVLEYLNNYCCGPQ